MHGGAQSSHLSSDHIAIWAHREATSLLRIARGLEPMAVSLAFVGCASSDIPLVASDQMMNHEGTTCVLVLLRKIGKSNSKCRTFDHLWQCIQPLGQQMAQCCRSGPADVDGRLSRVPHQVAGHP
jgi:hypothetical protein